jgi:hypothetical protein
MAEATTTQVEAGKQKRSKDEKVKERASTASTSDQARQEIRRARRLAVEGKPTPEATHTVSIAGVLALLDLAGAVRENGRRSPKA